MLPCWRLWWNSNPGAFVRWQGRRIALGPDRFVLVAPETPFEVELRKPIARHVFIHFGLATNQWRLTNRVIEVAAETIIIHTGSDGAVPTFSRFSEKTRSVIV